MDLNTKISELAGVGLAYVKRLSKIGIFTVSDLLFHFPRRYDDFSMILPIGQAKAGETVSVKGSVWQIVNKRSRRGMMITEAVVADETGTIKAVWFNQPFLKNTLKTGDEVVLAGKLEWNFGTVAMQSPAYEKLAKGWTLGGELKHTGRIVPMYPETEGLSSKWLRFKIKPLLKMVENISEYLPEVILKKYNLLGIQESIQTLHFPTDYSNLEKAKRRIDFEEMFLLQLAVISQKKLYEKDKAPEILFNESFAKEFVSKLGFTITNAQRKASFEILKDMEKPHPMNRLLEGDVGSGKTIVAAMALAMAAKQRFQGVIITPTEILARQHYEGFVDLLSEFNVGILTGNHIEIQKTKVKRQSLDFARDKNCNSKVKKSDLLDLIKSRKIDILIGTHALFNEKIEFNNLGLVIIDEQHRFGVEQRTALRKENKKGLMPHFLSMSATPIPRTLTLTIYGDLDVSILDEMPPGRKPVATRLVENFKRNEAYKFIDDKIKEGRQIFVVCPLIEESDKLGVKSVTAEFEKLEKNIFAHRKIGMLHGKMKPKEKDKVMGSFADGDLDILVATSVVEVGVNIPNACLMMIEGADRFGLAQLHQFRGRVGRGEYQSYCLLFTDSNNEITMKRLHSFVNTQDGFKLAEADLEIRGPGEIFGKLQHGMPDIQTKNLMNLSLIKETRKAVEEFLRENDLSSFPLLQEKAGKYNVIKVLE